MSKARTITLTEREFSAIVDAAALYEAEYSAYDGDDQPPAYRQNCLALDRVVDKWHTEAPKRSDASS